MRGAKKALLTMMGSVGATVPWYLAGGAPAPLGAWLAVGAASQAASYVNLANPGTYNLIEVGSPIWDTVNGWSANGSFATNILNTGIIPANNTYTYLCKFASAPAGGIAMGIGGSPTWMWIYPNNGSGNRGYYHGGANSIVGAQANATMVIAGPNCYLNGVADGTITQGAVAGLACYLLCRNNGGAPGTVFSIGRIHAAAIWNSTLTGPQVAAIVAALNA